MELNARDVVLVTGGCGFIGGCFVETLLRNRDAGIVVVDKLTYAADLPRIQAMQAQYGQRLAFTQGDISDSRMMRQMMDSRRITRVINFAAESHVDRSIDNPEPFVDTNVVGAFRLAEVSLRYWSSLKSKEERQRFRMLHVSTDEVYGSCTGDAFTEDQPYCPTSLYAASKAAADHLVMAYYRTYGLPVLGSIASNNFGPYQFPEKLIPVMIREALSGGVLPIYGDGQQQRDWLYVEDHCTGLLDIIERGRPGQSYHIASGNCITNRELVETLCDILERETGSAALRSRIQSVIDRPGHDYCYRLDTSKIRSELGWEPSGDFQQRLTETVKWYIQHQTWMNEKRAQSGADRRIGLRGIGMNGSNG